MQQNPYIQRAFLLFETARFDAAEQELRQGLVHDPGHPTAHSLLALCLSERDDFRGAATEAGQGIHLAPDDPFSHYAYAQVMQDRNRFDEAQQAIEHAIALDPSNASYRGKLAQIHFSKRRWQQALDAADAGLEFDPEDDLCVNLRAMSLVKLGRSDAAEGAIDSALARDPDNAFTHANLGWTLIDQGDHKKALEHFREALRIDPTMEFAQAGIVEALNSRNFVYRWMLAWFMWMNKLSSQAQWMVVIGGYILYQILRSVARNNPQLAPYILPLLVIYVVFAVMTWMASPLFNLLLRLDKDGRLVLSSDQIRTANWVGIAVVGAFIFLIGWLVQGSQHWLVDAIACALLIPPLSTILNCHEGWPRNWMIVITGLMLFMLAVILGTQLASVVFRPDIGIFFEALGVLVFFAYLFVGIGTQFAANYFSSAVPRR